MRGGERPIGTAAEGIIRLPDTKQGRRAVDRVVKLIEQAGGRVLLAPNEREEKVQLPPSSPLQRMTRTYPFINRDDFYDHVNGMQVLHQEWLDTLWVLLHSSARPIDQPGIDEETHIDMRVVRQHFRGFESGQVPLGPEVGSISWDVVAHLNNHFEPETKILPWNMDLHGHLPGKESDPALHTVAVAGISNGYGAVPIRGSLV